MIDLKETAVNYVAGDDFITIYTAERKWINKINALKEKCPSEVNIQAVNDDESIVAHVPIKWFKFPSPPKKVSDEFREAASERFKKYHSSKT